MSNKQYIFFTILLITLVSAKKDGENSVSSTSLLEEQSNFNDICKTKICVPKCCPQGQLMLGSKKCRPPKRKARGTFQFDFSDTPLFKMDFTKSGMSLKDALDLNLIALTPGKLSDENFTAYDYTALRHRYYLTEKGILIEEAPNTFNRFTKLNNSFYCMDYLYSKAAGMKIPEVRFLTKYVGESIDSDDPVITYGLLVSCFFLALLLLVYALLRELRNLHGRVLMAYVSSLLGAFLLLAVIQLDSYLINVCKGLTYCTYFFLLASFCWMNIMSCDIWWTFRGYAKARPIHRRGETFKFCMYCIYAWGLPAALTTMVIIVDNVDMKHLPWFVTPNIGLRGTFFGGQEKFLYLYIPMLILIICNWLFFLMTAFNIWRLHRATAVLDSAAAGTPAAHRSQKYRFLVYLKLSVIMGINWVLEVVSSFYPHFKGWYLSDIYNMLIGLSIFLIFVCKRKILRMLVRRFRECKWKGSRKCYSRSRSHASSTTESDVSTEVTVCINPKGPVYYDRR